MSSATCQPPVAAEHLCRWGYPVRTYSPECVAAIDDYFFEVLSYGRRRGRAILAATRLDPTCVLAAVLAAFHFGRGRGFMAAANANLMLASEYEKAVVRAVNCLVGEDKDEDAAIQQHFELLKNFPRDLVSLKRAQVLCFYMGIPDISLKLVEQVMPQNQNEDYICGMLAFALLELGRMDEAEKAAKKGLEINKNDVWSQHGICHVFQQDCRFMEAVKFMESHSYTWDKCGSFMYTHNWWHVAVCYLEGEAPIDRVIHIYDIHIMKELENQETVPAEVYINALGLLLRIDVRGQMDFIIERLNALVVALRNESEWHQEWLLDLLILWALACMKESKKAEDLLQSMKSMVSHMGTKNRLKMLQVIPLAEAINLYGARKYKEVLHILGPDFQATDYKMVGASDEQLDVFNEMWQKVIVETGEASKAIDIIANQVNKREGAPLLWRLLAKAHLRQGRTDDALAAQSKANSLAASYFH